MWLNKLYDTSYCRYLVGDTRFLFFYLVSTLKRGKILFLKKILISQTKLKPKKAHKEKQE